MKMNEVEKFFRERWGVKGEALLKNLLESSSVKTFAKNEFLFKTGDEISTLYFLLDGFYRGFFIDENGNEVTTCIGEKYGCTAAPYTVMFEPISNENLQVMQDSKFLCVPAKLIHSLLETDTELWRIYNAIIEEVREFHWNIKDALNGTDASARYEWFRQNFPKANEGMTNEQICSFLGIAPVTLSRIKNA